MKNLYIIIILISININAQSMQESTTEEYNDNVNTSNNFTKIKLFDVEYNGEKIPIELSYSHDGIKVNELENSSLGIHWKIENIGYINRTINYLSDHSPKGWFNTLDPSFNSSSIYGRCYSCDEVDPSSVGGLYENDLSPDFFSVNLINGNNFDFFYKKNIQNNLVGLPIPELLSNPNEYKVNTNFNNFYTDNTIFNILDKFGNNYDFVKGPDLYDSRRAFQDVIRNNYYLKSITNPFNSDYININYITNDIPIKEKYYATGFNLLNANIPGGPSNVVINPDYYTPNVRSLSGDFYNIDETKFEIKKITSNKVIVDFVYTTDNRYLNEINISDLKGNYISGYKFEYIDFDLSYGASPLATAPKALFQIKKYNNNKTLSQLIYEFEYFESGGYSHFGLDGYIWTEQYKDHFGYFNNAQKENTLPISVRKLEVYDGYIGANNCCNVMPGGNFEPDLYWCKVFSLHKIINKYGGITEFDYQLNQGVHDELGNLNGGGLVISSKKTIPIIGKPMLTSFNYHNLSGFTIQTNNLLQHYAKYASDGISKNAAFFSSIPLLREAYDTPYGQVDPEVFTIHKTGNFFSRVTESIYNLDNMTLESSITREYVPNSEGVYRRPLLKTESFKNSLNQEIKKIEYFYNYQTLETINSSEYRVEKRDNGRHWMLFKTSRPIYVNRVDLIGTKEETFTNTGTITNNSSFSYVNSNTKLLRNKIELSSLGENIEERYFYPQDTQMTSEPFVTDLIAKNFIGIPLKTEKYRNNEKLSEQKSVYANDATTNNLLLPKFIYSKKGDVINNTLEKKMTFDIYDTNGTLLQYTIENGVPISIIWGYNKTQIIAKIENVAYATIPASLITAAQTASNTNNETNLLLALSDLRNNSSLASALVTSYTFKPLIGVSTITDPKGDKITYEYDELNHQKGVKDKNGYILSETVYHTNN
jgi:hypothetical protein